MNEVILKNYLIFLWLILSSPAFGVELFTEESEKDIPLRSIGKLQITNVKGDIHLQGWAFDKIRIKIKKEVTAANRTEASKFFQALEYRFRVNNEDVEISSQYGNHLSIPERLREKEGKVSRMNMWIQAPTRLKAQLWTIDGKTTLKGWNADVNLRSNSGAVEVEGVKGKSLSLQCISCSAQIKNVRSSVRCIGDSGHFELSYVAGPSVFVEISEGHMKLSHTQGEQLLISKSGSIEGQFLKGKVQFHTGSGQVDINEVFGVLGGSTESGKISARINDWIPQGETLIESKDGDIQIALPDQFSGNVDLLSVNGNAQLAFPIERLTATPSTASPGPNAGNRIAGRIRDGGELLRVLSENGNVHVFKGKF